MPKKTFTKPVRQLIKTIAIDFSIESLPKLPPEYTGYGLDDFRKGNPITLGQLAGELRYGCLLMNGEWDAEAEEDYFLCFEKAGFHIVNLPV